MRFSPSVTTTPSSALSTIADYRRAHADLEQALAGIHSPLFHVYQVADAYCHPDCAISNAEGMPYYYDGDHMTFTGSRLLEATLDRVVIDLLGRQDLQSAKAP